MTQRKMSSETERSLRASQAIFDGRPVTKDSMAQIMVTLESTVATVLLALFRDQRFAAAMLREALAPAVEERLALHEARHGRRDPR